MKTAKVIKICAIWAFEILLRKINIFTLASAVKKSQIDNI
jgi:hypothetical protein